ncbi:type II toxin-antitoxin system RelE/ParE family toxin [Rhizobium leguminosarum]|nr:type II toxin-antitoxin system RelE/ParE family toxin [Rhizobium leguminosarum]
MAPGATQRHGGTAFKTGWFAKAARKARISDSELSKAIRQVAEGKADDQGGGVFKKRLNGNQHRSFAKLAKSYAGLSDSQLEELLDIGHFVEIEHGKKHQVQERCVRGDSRLRGDYA